MFVIFSFNHKGLEPNDALRTSCENALQDIGLRLLKGEGAYRNRGGEYNTEISYCTKVKHPSQVNRIVELCRMFNQESILILNNLADTHEAVTIATLHYLDGRTVDIGQWVEVPRSHALADENGFSRFNGKHYVVRGAA